MSVRLFFIQSEKGGGKFFFPSNHLFQKNLSGQKNFGPIFFLKEGQRWRKKGWKFSEHLSSEKKVFLNNLWNEIFLLWKKIQRISPKLLKEMVLIDSGSFSARSKGRLRSRTRGQHSTEAEFKILNQPSRVRNSALRKLISKWDLGYRGRGKVLLRQRAASVPHVPSPINVKTNIMPPL